MNYYSAVKEGRKACRIKSFVNMELDINWEEKSVSPEEQEELIKLLKEGIYQALITGKGPEDAEIGLVMVDDETIHLLNKTYRGVDRPTDVLSFAMQEKGEGEPEIFMDDLYDEEIEKDELDTQDEADDNKEDLAKKADFSVEVIMDEELRSEEEYDEDEDISGIDDNEFTVFEDAMLGDIVISVERARLQAEEFGHSLAREIVYLAVHGTYHLLGYDHCNDEDNSVMRRLEEQVMEQIGLPR